MKFRVQRHELLSVLHKAGAVTSKKSPMPILSCMLLETQKDTVKVTANDLECAFEGRCPAEVSEEGKTAVPGAPLLNMVRNLNSEVIDFKLDNNQLVMRGNSTKASFVTMPVEEFPQLKEPDEMIEVEIPSESFISTIKMILPCASRDAYEQISVIDLENKKNKLRFAATDRIKLAYAEINDITIPDNFPAKTSIPVNSITRVISLIDSEEISLCLNDKKPLAVIKDGSYTYHIRLSEYSFPEYENALQDRGNLKVEINIDELKEAFKRIKVLDSPHVSLTFERNRLIVESAESELGNAREEIAANGPQETQKIFISQNTLPQIISPVRGETIVLSFSTPERPCYVTIPDDPSYLAVFMPLATVEE